MCLSRNPIGQDLGGQDLLAEKLFAAILAG